MNKAVCPVATLKCYLEVRPNILGPVFCHFDHKPLTRYQFSAVLKKAINLLDYGIYNFKSHSFRIGMATSLSMEGYSDEQIKIMGRWESNAYLRYIRLPV